MRMHNIIIAVMILIILLAFWINSTSHFRFNLEKFYIERGDYEKAIRISEKILRKDEIEVKNPLTFRSKKVLPVEEKQRLAKGLADYYLRSGSREKAITYYEMLKETNPKKIADYLNLYVLNQDMERLVDIVLDSKQRGLKNKLLPEYLKMPLWRYYYGVGLIERRRWQEAKDEFLQLAREYPYLSTFHYCLGYALQGLGLTEESREQYRITDGLNPGSIVSPDSLRAEDFKPSFDLIGIWKLDEGGGNIAKDITGRYKGQIKGADWVDGISGYALDFDGVDDTVILLEDCDFHLDGRDFTIAMWVKPAPQENHRFVYFKWRPSLYLHKDDNTWIFQVQNTGGCNEIRINEPVSDKWYFVVQRLKHEKGHKVWLFDKDGLIKTAEKEFKLATVGSDRYPFRLSHIGWAGDRFDKFFKGLIDEVYMFDRALASAEIERLYEMFRAPINETVMQ